MFSRWRSLTRHTLSYRLFIQHHNEINALYGSHRVAADRMLQIVKKSDKRLKPAALFRVRRRELKRTPPTLAQWEREFKDFNNWARLSASVAINAYMEIYLRQISALAIESNPGIVIGAPGAIDGVALLKSRPDYSYAEQAVHFVKGDWNTRITHYEKLFGEAPEKLKASAKELNELRKMRNGVGHAFGRSVDDYDAAWQVKLKPMMRLSEERFDHWLQMVDEVTSAIDGHLKRTHIGEYELLLYYHQWRRKKGGEAAAGTLLADFRQAVTDDFGELLELAFLQELIAYYERC